MATNTTDLLRDVNAGMATAETTLNNKLLDAVFDGNEGSGSSSELEAFKDQVSVTLVRKSEVPNEVYEAVATAVLDAVQSSTIKKLSTNQTTRTKEIGAAISGGLSSIYNQQIPVNGNNYTVSVTIMSFAGVGDCFADVSWKTSTGTTKKAHLTWTNVGTKNGNQALATFCSALSDLNTQLWKEFASYALTGSTKGKKIFDYAERIIKALGDKNAAAKLVQEVGSIFSTELKSSAYNKLRTFIKKNVPGGDVIISSIDLLKTLETKKAALETAVSNNKNVDAKLKDFNKACTNLEKKLGASIGTFTLEPPAGMSYNSKYTEMTISGAYGNQLNVSDYRETVTKINASSRSKAIEIAGNVKNNQISGGSGDDKVYGGNGKDTLYGGNGKDSLYGEKDADKIYGDAENDMLSGGDGNDTLYGGADNDSLYGDAGNDKLFGDAGNDTLVGGAGKDTLTGGNGADVFVYANGDGDDTILDYVSGQDKIKISSGSVSSYSVSGGKDAVLKVGKGKITLKGVGNNQVTVITSDNKTVIYGGIASGVTFNKADLPKATAATINSNYSGKFDAGAYSSLATINASSRTNAIEVVGNKKANKIQGGSSNDILRGDDGNDTLYGGADNDSLYGDAGTDKLYGDAGNDTLIGGLGNDTMTGGAGKDVFYYTNGDGADVIVDFTSNEDKIYISGATSVTGSLSKNDVTFKVGKGSIKVQNSKDKEITIAYSNGTEKKYVNGVLSTSSPTNPTNPSVGGGGDYNAPTVVLTSNMSSPFKIDEYNKTASKKVKNIDARGLLIYFNIYADDQANVIWAGKGGGNISSYAGNDVIYLTGDSRQSYDVSAGNGDDTIYIGDGYAEINYYYGNGNDTIYGFKSSDKIYLGSSDAGLKNISFSGNDVILNLQTGNTITLKDAKDKKIYPYSSYTNKGTSARTFGRVTFSGNTVVLDADYSGTFETKWYEVNPQNVNASEVTNYQSIYTDDRDNVIWAGKGGGNISSYAGNDVIYLTGDSHQSYDVSAGNGDDTIYVGDGYAEINYYYGNGNDTIYGFKSSDKVYLGSSDAKLNNISYNGNDAILNLTSGNTITLKNAKNTTIHIGGYSSGTYNQSTSSASARVAEDYWFDEDDNFVGNDTSMDSIMEENYTVTNIETSDFSSLTNDEFNLTYSQTDDNQ